jgi:serine/threonine protein kinase
MGPAEQMRAGRLPAISSIAAQWDQQTPSAASALAERPDLASRKSVVLALAYEEYFRRSETGERIDIEAFCDQFPLYRASVRRRIDVHCVFDQGEVRRHSGQRWPRPPQSFCGFELISEIGQGGIGRVYLARQRELGNRTVVLKVSRAGHAEANLLGRLQHPNVMPVYSVAEDHETGLTIVCMPLLGLATLEDVLDQIVSTLPAERSGAVFAETVDRMNGQPGATRGEEWMRLSRQCLVNAILSQFAQIADALEYLDAAGICHRDLKPSNILLADDARPVLLDFNLSDELASTPRRLGGTLPYMAPEQIRRLSGDDDQALDARADIFSMGVILYEMLTGRLPFGPISKNPPLGQVQAQLLDQQQRGPQLHPLKAADVDPLVVRIVSRCLAFEPGDRFGSAREAASAIRAALTRRIRAKRWVESHRWASAAVAVLVLVAIAAFGTWLALRKPYYERLFHEGLVAYHAGDFGAALDAFRDSSDANPNSLAATIGIARVLEAKEQYTQAIEEYQKLYERTGDPRFLASIGYCENMTGDHHAAIENYTRAIQMGVRSAMVLNNLGYSCFKYGDLPGARLYLDQALSIRPGFPSAIRNRVKLELTSALEGNSTVSAGACHEVEALLEAMPACGSLHYTAALLWVLSDLPGGVSRAVDHAHRAVEYGMEAQQIIQDKILKAVLSRQDIEELRRHQCESRAMPEPKAIAVPEDSDKIFWEFL